MNVCTSQVNLKIDHTELVVKPVKEQDSLPGKLLLCLLNSYEGRDPLKVIEDLDRNTLKKWIKQAEDENWYSPLFVLYKEYPEILSDSILEEAREILKHYARMNVLLKAPLPDPTVSLNWTTADYKTALQRRGFLPNDENASLVHSEIFWTEWWDVAVEEGLYHINGAIRSISDKLQRDPTTSSKALED